MKRLTLNTERFTGYSLGIGVVLLAAVGVIVYVPSGAAEQSPKTASSRQPQAASSVQTQIEQMPLALETRFALSALPPAMREHATVHRLDPTKGYELARRGTSGMSCLVERTAWEQADFRNDIYVPLCYDAAGTKTFLKVIMDAAALRAQGMNPIALKVEIENRYKNGTYTTPDKPGLSYMVAPLMRTWMHPDRKVHTMTFPHLMFYAPNVTNEDVGAVPGLDPLRAIIFEEGIAEQSYIVHVVGEAEKASIIANEKALLGDLCAYRDVLCQPAISR